ncbi:MAG: NAD(P)H-binding protein [Parafilimonas sp.]|nr:NAD(P)H-binding protein [Parafilimonas sp.]
MIKFTGQFYKYKGYPKGYFLGEEKVDKAKIFKYTKYVVLRSMYREFCSSLELCKMKLIITGATGMVGSEVLRQSIADDEIESVTIIVRRQTDITHPKLKTIIHQIFLDYSNLTDVFKNNDACIWCLGISQNLVSKEEYIKITYDYTVAFARDMLKVIDAMSFLFLSGRGADNTEKTRVLFGKIKGRTENALHQLPFQKLYIARPAGILPIHKQKNLAFILRLQYALVKVFSYITPSFIIKSDELAKALIYIVKNNASSQLYNDVQLKQIAKQLS